MVPWPSPTPVAVALLGAPAAAARRGSTAATARGAPWAVAARPTAAARGASRSVAHQGNGGNGVRQVTSPGVNLWETQTLSDFAMQKITSF